MLGLLLITVVRPAKPDRFCLAVLSIGLLLRPACPAVLQWQSRGLEPGVFTCGHPFGLIRDGDHPLKPREASPVAGSVIKS